MIGGERLKISLFFSSAGVRARCGGGTFHDPSMVRVLL
jgi:hypothetical protein